MKPPVFSRAVRMFEESQEGHPQGRCLWDCVDKGQGLSFWSPCLSHLSPLSIPPFPA